MNRWPCAYYARHFVFAKYFHYQNLVGDLCVAATHVACFILICIYLVSIPVFLVHMSL